MSTSIAENSLDAVIRSGFPVSEKKYRTRKSTCKFQFPIPVETHPCSEILYVPVQQSPTGQGILETVMTSSALLDLRVQYYFS